MLPGQTLSPRSLLEGAERTSAGVAVFDSIKEFHRRAGSFEAVERSSLVRRVAITLLSINATWSGS